MNPENNHPDRSPRNERDNRTRSQPWESEENFSNQQEEEFWHSEEAASDPKIEALRQEQLRAQQRIEELRQEETRLNRHLQELRQQETHLNRRLEAIQLEEEERRVSEVRRRLAISKTEQVIYYLTGALGVLLLLRVLLRVLGANPDNQFAGFIYALSYPFVAPFQTLFGTPEFGASAFEINALIAIAVYALLTWLTIRLIRVIWS